MKNIIKMIILLLTFTGNYVSAQNTESIKIGDDVPELQIDKIINSNRSAGNLKDYKNQLLIIDFWATGCSGCVEGLPKMMSLQKEFGEKITILPVTFEKEESVSKFLKKNHLTKNLKIPTVVEDKALSALFKHQNIPHEVWIYKGKLIAVTFPEYVDAINIEYVLNGGTPKWFVKNDFYEHDYSKPLFFSNQGMKTDDMLYSAVSNYREGIDTKHDTEYDSLTNVQRSYFTNYPVLAMYTIAWRHLIKLPFGFITPNRYIMEVKDRHKYMYEGDKAYSADWQRKNSICYETRLKGMRKDHEMAKIFIADLDHLLNLRGRWEKKKVKCLILTMDKSMAIPESKSENPLLEQKENVLHFRKVSLATFAFQMNHYFSNPLVFDETDYKIKIDMDLNVSSLAVNGKLKSELLKYGLSLTEQEREEYFFVLTELDK